MRWWVGFGNDTSRCDIGEGCLEKLYDSVSRGGFMILGDYHTDDGRILGEHESPAGDAAGIG